MEKQLYSVSLVFSGEEERHLKCLITNAINEHEALGKAINYYKEETKGLKLDMEVVLPCHTK